MTTPSTHDYVSIGLLANHLQCSVRTIEAAVASLGVVPALRLNGVIHFDADQVESIITAIHAGPVAQRAASLR